MSIDLSGGNKLLYLDCCSGISGDMLLGALLDLGLDLKDLQSAIAGLALPDVAIEMEQVNRGAIACTKAHVLTSEKNPPARHLADVIGIINQADLPDPVRANSIAVFTQLAEAEAAVHGCPVEQVHFHEVGAADAIVDVVGTAAALHLLGVDQLICSPLPLSRGEVDTAHGRLPLPAPATLKLLASRAVPVYGSTADFELVTPTGAALVTALADSFGSLPGFTVTAVGYGAGSRDDGSPNYLRLLYGFTDRVLKVDEENAILIESNLDDLNPEIFGYLMEQLFEAGAADVYFTAIQMKKNRPAVQLNVLAASALLRDLQEIIFRETTTLGLRVSVIKKIMRKRETAVVQTEWGPVRIKYVPAEPEEHILHFSPEFEDCRIIARLSGQPLKEIYRQAVQLFKLSS